MSVKSYDSFFKFSIDITDFSAIAKEVYLDKYFLPITFSFS